MPRFSNLYELPARIRMNDANDFQPAIEKRSAHHRKISEAPATLAHPTPHPDRVLVTVVFIDIVGSTEKAVELGDSAWMEFLGEFQRFVRAELRRFKGREIDTAGDGFFATFDVPARAVRCAMGIAEHVRALGIEIRAGCHTGEVELAKDGVRGVGVVIGARIGALARPGEVVCSSTVKDVTAGSGLLFEDLGPRALKGIPDEWHLYAVKSNPAPPAPRRR